MDDLSYESSDTDKDVSLNSDSEVNNRAEETKKNESEVEEEDDDDDDDDAANDIISPSQKIGITGNKRASETRESVNSTPSKIRKISSISNTRNDKSVSKKTRQTNTTKESVPKKSKQQSVAKRKSSTKPISSESESDSTKSNKPISRIRKGENPAPNYAELENNMANFSTAKRIGNFKVNIEWFQAPRPDYLTRPIDESFLVLLMNSFRTHSSGHLMRQPLQLNLAFREDTLQDDIKLDRAKNIILYLKTERSSSKKSYNLLQELKKYCLFETIGGNHTRTACQKILESDPKAQLGYDENHTFDTVIWYNLSVTQAKIVGLLDNVIKNVTKNLTNFDKVNQTRQVWKDKRNIQNPNSPKRDWTLKNEAFEQIVKIVFYDPNVEISQRTFNQKNPFIKGCHIPKCAWPTFSTLLQKDILTITHIRNYCFYDNKNLLRVACAKLNEAMSNNSDKSRISTIFRTYMDDIKFTSKIAPSIYDTYKKIYPETKSIDEMFDAFETMEISFSDFYDHKDLAFIKTKKGKKGGLKTQELAIINSIIKEKITMFENLQKFKDQQDKFIYTFFDLKNDNVNYEKISHLVLECDALSALQSLCKSHTFYEHEKIGIIFLDPPFGILDVEKETWDVKWKLEYWDNIFNLLQSSEKFKDVPIVFFGTLDMICEIFQVAANNRYHQTFFTWEKFNIQSQITSFITQTSSPVVLYHTGKSPAVVFHDPEQYTYSMRGRTNLLVCSYDKHVIDKQGNVVNVTQKPVDLYRNFIFRFCPKNQIVLDICAGSGTGAIAAASFGYSSISIDNRQNQCDAIRERIKKTDIHINCKHPQHVCSFKISFKDTDDSDEEKDDAKKTPKKSKDDAKKTPRKSRAKNKSAKSKKVQGQALSQPIARTRSKDKETSAKPIAFQDADSENKPADADADVGKQAISENKVTDERKKPATDEQKAASNKSSTDMDDKQESEEIILEEDSEKTNEEENSQDTISNQVSGGKQSATISKTVAKFFETEAFDNNHQAAEADDPMCSLCEKNRVHANFMCNKQGEAFCSEKCFKSHCSLCDYCKQNGSFIDDSEVNKRTRR